MANDDLSFDYEASRQGAYNGRSALAEAMNEFPTAPAMALAPTEKPPTPTPGEPPAAPAPRAPTLADASGNTMPTAEQMGEGGERVMAVGKDIALGAVETVRNQALGGMRDATQEVLELTRLSEIGLSLPEVSEPQTVTGGLARSTAQFLTGFLPAFRVVKGGATASMLAKTGKAMLAGAFADAVVFDPHEERLSNLVQSFPALQNPVTDYLAADANDSEAEGRFKNAAEGLALGGMVDGLTTALGALRQARKIKATAVEATLVPEPIKIPLGDETKPLVEVVDEAAPLAREAGDEAPPMFPVERADPLMDAAKITGEELRPDDFEIVTPGVPERAVNLNLSRIQTPDDVKEALATVGDIFRPQIDEARRGKITLAETSRLADDLGLSVETLLERRRGQAFNAEEAVAARRILESSGRQLVSLAKKAASGDSRPSDLIAFRRSLALHHAVQSEVSGMTAEAGRALSAFRIMAKGGAEQSRQIKEIIEASGGSDFSRAMAAKMATLDKPEQLVTFVKQAQKATTIDMIQEAWINGLLSGPQTHVVNTLSNTLTNIWQIPERFVASQIGQTLGGGEIGAREALAQAYGLVRGAKDGFKMAARAFRVGESSDLLGKVEMPRRAISGENLEAAGAAGRVWDFVGNVVRLPTRFLTAEDEFFKGVGYRMELHALAFRQARAEGLAGADMAKRMADIIAEPPDTIRLASIDAARYQTFTAPLGRAGAKLQGAIAESAALRFVVPFFRTPVNIMKFAGERSPLAPLSKAVREEISAGGARRDLALAKIATGSMLMSVVTEMAAGGRLTGGDLANKDMRAIRRDTGWQPYSVKIGDKYYAYNRLDPLGVTIGIAADLAEILPKLDEAEADELAAAAVLAISKNVVSKTYLQGISNVVEIFDEGMPELGASKGKRFVRDLLSSSVPTLFAQIARTNDPTLRHVEGMIDAFKNRLPEYREDLPPRRNLWGDPIVLEGGLGPDLMSPIYTSTVKDDPVSEEILRLGKPVSMPPRDLGGVELTPEQYDRFVTIAAKEVRGPSGLTLKDDLRAMMRGVAYRRASDGEDGVKADLVQAKVNAFQDAAVVALMRENPDLFAEINRKRMEAAEAKRPLF